MSILKLVLEMNDITALRLVKFFWGAQVSISMTFSADPSYFAGVYKS